MPKILNFVKKIHYYSELFTSLLGEEDADEVKRVGGESGIADEFELGPDGVSLKRGLVVKSENRSKKLASFPNADKVERRCNVSVINFRTPDHKPRSGYLY